MTEAIEYEQFEQGGSSNGAVASDADLSRLSDIPMELSVEIGRTHMTVGETLDLRVGSVVTLERLAGETADLLVNATSIARGEFVVIDEQYGLRITEILDGSSEHEPPQAAEDGQAQDTPGATGEQAADAAVPEPAGPEAADAEPGSGAGA